MEAKRRAVIDFTCAGRLPYEIAIALIIHRNTINNVENILNKRHNSSIPSMPMLDDPDHVKHVPARLHNL